MSLGYLSPLRVALVGTLALLVAGLDCEPAQARASHRAKEGSRHHVFHGPGYRPPYAAIVVDANSGQVLHEESADEPRHPASVTKIMTLYLLFEQIEAGKFKLDTPLKISSQAAIQPPTKLGLKTSQTITVDDAIKGLCTRSANDAAVVVAEAVGGSEGEFGRLMTLKARELGMSNTTYVNASGLPAEEQVTTARDQAILGRKIQERFPEFFKYFSTLSFRYRGAEIHNHNGLLGQVPGVDGIKTGYTEASGYNLVASVRRDARRIVAVVLGGNSGATRNERMRQLIEVNIPKASMQIAAPAAPTITRETRPAIAPAEKAAEPAVVVPELKGPLTEPMTPMPIEAVAPKATEDATPKPEIAAPKPAEAATPSPAEPAAPSPAETAPKPTDGLAPQPAQTPAPTLASARPDHPEAAKPQPTARSRGQGKRPIAKPTAVPAVVRPPSHSW
jgi:D-alanyl-D-alanine carboxypeptidase